MDTNSKREFLVGSYHIELDTPRCTPVIGQPFAALRADWAAPSHGPTSAESGFWRFMMELRQRKVCRAALLYAIAVWLVFQIAEIVFPALQLPQWALSLVVMLGVLGFPIALVLAWIFKITPTGLRLDLPTASSHAELQGGRRELALNCGLMILAAALSLQLLGASFAGHLDAERDLRQIETLAITPFVQGGPGVESETLGRGLASELRYLLTRDGGVRVLATTSPSDKELPQDFTTVLQGSIHVGADHTRVIVHLIDRKGGEDLWSAAIEEPHGSSIDLQQRLAIAILRALPLRHQAIGEQFAQAVPQQPQS